MKSLREAFPDVDESVKTFAKAVPIVIKAHKDVEARIKDQETQIASLRSENETKTKTSQEVADAKDKEIADLRRQLADTEQAKTDQQAQLERSLAEANENFKDRDAKLIAPRSRSTTRAASPRRRRRASGRDSPSRAGSSIPSSRSPRRPTARSSRSRTT